MSLNLYLISRDGSFEYDMYDEAIVAAEDDIKARNIHPSGQPYPQEEDSIFSTWVSPDLVNAKLIGFAIGEIKEGVICASYNAG